MLGTFSILASSVNDLIIHTLPKWVFVVLENVQVAEVISEWIIGHILILTLNSFVISTL